jgi:hypothetical protein
MAFALISFDLTSKKPGIANATRTRTLIAVVEKSIYGFCFYFEPLWGLLRGFTHAGERRIGFACDVQFCPFFAFGLQGVVATISLILT